MTLGPLKRRRTTIALSCEARVFTERKERIGIDGVHDRSVRALSGPELQRVTVVCYQTWKTARTMGQRTGQRPELLDQGNPEEPSSAGDQSGEPAQGR